MTDNKAEVDHIGFRVDSAESYGAVRQALSMVGMRGEQTQAEGHIRTFYDLGGGVKMEVQLWEADMPQRRQQMVHLDLRSHNPIQTLQLVSDQAEDWGLNAVPRGGVRVTDGFMIMARPMVK